MPFIWLQDPILNMSSTNPDDLQYFKSLFKLNTQEVTWNITKFANTCIWDPQVPSVKCSATAPRLTLQLLVVVDMYCRIPANASSKVV